MFQTREVPLHPDFRDYTQRLQSFIGSPPRVGPTVEELASNGFYYIGELTLLTAGVVKTYDQFRKINFVVHKLYCQSFMIILFQIFIHIIVFIRLDFTVLR